MYVRVIYMDKDEYTERVLYIVIFIMFRICCHAYPVTPTHFTWSLKTRTYFRMFCDKHLYVSIEAL